MSENNMSEINSIEELRIYADTFDFETQSKLNEIADNIELELEEKYIKPDQDTSELHAAEFARLIKKLTKVV